jgi:HK97 family phage major capsid protein
MPANNEKDQSELVTQLFQSEKLKGVISDEIKAQAKHNMEIQDTIKQKDPYGVHEIFDALGTDKTPDGRDYQGMIDMGYRVRDWLESNGTFFSDKVQKVVKMSFQDAVHSKDMQFLFPKVVSNIVIEHMEPQSNLLGLYEKIRFQNGTSITFPVWSAGGSSINLHIAEEAEPNELTGDMSSFVTATTGKVGIKASISEDALRYSVIDLYRLQLKWCGIALGRFKERQAVENLYKVTTGKALFSNTTGGSSVYGNTNGCDASGNRNGTLSSYDLFEAYCHGLAQGSDLNTIIIHPLGWRALANNSVLRDRAQFNGGKIWEGPQGGSSDRKEVGSGLNKMFNPNYRTKTLDGNSIATQATTFSGTISVLGQPFNVITTPFAPIRKLSNALINDQAGTGSDVVINGKYAVDILMIDPRDVGYHIVDQELYTREEDRLFKQIKETAFFERYGFGSANQGVGLFRLNGVVATEGYDFLAAPVTIDRSNFTGPLGTLSV